jgi:predicted PurR-regulated permease PerM
MESPAEGGSPRWRSPTWWLLVAALVLSALVVKPFALELGTGLVFGFVSERPVAWMLRRAKRDGLAWRWAAATTFVSVVMLVLLLPAVFALWVALRDAAELLTGEHAGDLGRGAQTVTAWLQRRLAGYGMRFDPAQWTARLQGVGNAAASAVARGAGRALTATPAAVFSFVVVITSWVTFTVEGPSLRARVLPELLPWPREREIVARTTAGVIESVVLANVGVSTIQAGVVAVATVALRIPNAAVWSVASFALSFIPFVGTGIVTVSATLYLLASGRQGAAVAMAVVAVIAGSIDNVLRPLLTRGGMDLSFLWRLVAFVGGIAVFGLGGVILGPLVLALSSALWQAAHTRETT